MLLHYAVPGALAAIAFTVTWVLVVAFVLVVLAARFRKVREVMSARWWVPAGRVGIGAVTAISVPFAASGVVDIVTR